MTFYRTKGGEWINITKWQQKRDDLEDRLEGVVRSALRLVPDIKLSFKPKEGGEGLLTRMRPDATDAVLVFNMEGGGIPKPTVEPFEEVLVRCGAIRPIDYSKPWMWYETVDADGNVIRKRVMGYDLGEGCEGLGSEGRFKWVILKDGKYFKLDNEDRLFLSSGSCRIRLSEYVHEWGTSGVDEFEKAVSDVLSAFGQKYKFECVNDANRYCD
eukprot:jgi/Mesvir1/16672/Mv15074-RA.1